MKEFTESSTVWNRFLPHSDKGSASCPVDSHVYTLSICCVTLLFWPELRRLKEVLTPWSHLLIMTHLLHHCGLKLYCLTIIEQFENVSLATSICLFTNWMFEQTGFLLTVWPFTYFVGCKKKKISVLLFHNIPCWEKRCSRAAVAQLYVKWMVSCLFCHLSRWLEWSQTPSWSEHMKLCCSQLRLLVGACVLNSTIQSSVWFLQHLRWCQTFVGLNAAWSEPWFEDGGDGFWSSTAGRLRGAVRPNRAWCAGTFLDTSALTLACVRYE